MRNSPSESTEKVSFLLGGHRISPLLPWYRGQVNTPLEPESQAIMNLLKAEVFQSRVALSLDFHSGFGIHDRIWFPYARTVKPFPHLAEMYALKETFDRSFPNHFYRIEPQTVSYTTTHGDLWDHAYDLFRQQNSPLGKIYLPLFLEMGSWLWVRKNPWQIFSLLGPFNPIKPHRHKRILRRHLTLFDFLIRSLISPELWAHLRIEQHEKNESRARELWYPHD